MSLLTSLVAYWSLDEASGSATDVHGSNTLTANGSVGTAAGVIGTARSYARASTQYHSRLAPAELDVAGDRAVSVWIKATSFPANSGNYTGLVTYGKVGDVIWSLSLVNGASSQDTLRLEVQNSGGSYQAATCSTPLSTGTWYHVVGELNSGTLRIYVNGTSVATQSFTGSIRQTDSSTYNFALGRDWYDSSAARFFDGLIDECGLWQRGLTGAEVTSLYNGGAGLPYSSFGGGGGGGVFGQHHYYRRRRAGAS